ncbi:hypothetical protein [Bartonella tribocorum]|nr:hypothetical protein [Bartonella tribocorum]
MPSKMPLKARELATGCGSILQPPHLESAFDASYHDIFICF